MPTSQELQQALLLAVLNRAEQGGTDAAGDLDKLEELASKPEELAQLVAGEGPKNSLPTKKAFKRVTKGEGTCGQGERADLTGCTPASGGGGKKPSANKDEEDTESIFSFSGVPTHDKDGKPWLVPGTSTKRPTKQQVKDVKKKYGIEDWELRQLNVENLTPAEELRDPELANKIADAIKSGAVFPPIVMASDDPHFVDDGHHRVVGAVKARVSQIWALVPPGTGKLSKAKFFRNGVVRKAPPRVRAYLKKMALRQLLKSGGSCKPGQTAATTGCTPASGGGGKKPSTSKPDKKVDLGSVQKPAFMLASNNKLADELEAVAASGDFTALEDWTPNVTLGTFATNALNNYKQELIDKVQEHYQNNPDTKESQETPTVPTLPGKPKVDPATHPVLAENLDALEKLAQAGDLEAVKNYINPSTGHHPMLGSALQQYQEKLIQGLESSPLSNPNVLVNMTPPSTPQQAVQQTKADLQPNQPLPKLKSGIDTSAWSTTNSSAKFAANKIKQLEDLASAGKWDQFEKQKYIPTSAKPNTYQKKMVEAYQKLLAQKAKDNKGPVPISNFQPQQLASGNGQTQQQTPFGGGNQHKARVAYDKLAALGEKNGGKKFSTSQVAQFLGVSEDDDTLSSVLMDLDNDGFISVDEDTDEMIWTGKKPEKPEPQQTSNLAGKPCPPGVSATQTGCIPAQDQQGTQNPPQPKPGSAEHTVLEILDAAGSVNVDDLADEMEIDYYDAQMLLDKMTKAGYLKKKPSVIGPGNDEWEANNTDNEDEEDSTPVASQPSTPQTVQQQLQAQTIDPKAIHEALKKTNVFETEPSWKLPPGYPPGKVKMGGVVFNDKGQVLLREPSNHYDGYHWTFAKGGQEAGQHPVDTALDEVSQETGQKGAVIGFIPGIHESGNSKNCYFAMLSTGEDKSLVDAETASTKWVDFDEAVKLINQTTNPKGKQRDLEVLAAAKKAWEGGLKDKKLAGGQASQTPTSIDKNQLPDKPEMEDGYPNSTKVIGELEKLALAGDLEGIKAFDMDNVMDEVETYQWDLIHALEGMNTGQSQQDTSNLAGKPCLPGVSAAQTGCIPAADGQQEVDDWTQTGGQMGGNAGGKYKDKQGKEWYVKFSKSEAHAKNEVTAAKLYELAGAGVPAYELVKSKQGMATASAWLTHSSQKFDPSNPQHKEAACENFGIHAWLGNWDAIGHTYDNQTYVDGPNGPQLLTIDTGGSMLFRALGKPKKFTDEVDELKDMVSSKFTQAHAVFGGMTPEQKLKSYQKVLAVSADGIKAIVDKFGPGDEAGKQKLLATLLARKAFIGKAANEIAVALMNGKALPGSTPVVTKPVNNLPGAQKATSVYSIPPVPVINNPTYQLQAKLIWEAAQLSIPHVEQIHTNGTSKHGYTKKVHAYKMSVLSALKSGATSQTGKGAANQGGGPSQAIPGGLPAKPTFAGNTTINNLVNNMEKYALKGDVALILSVDPDIYTSLSPEGTEKLAEYQQGLLKSMLAGKPCPPGVSAAQTGCIPAGSGQGGSTPKIKPLELPSKPTVTSSDAIKKATKQADVDALEKLALAGDLPGLQAYKLQEASSTTSSYQNELVAHINDILNPPPPPKPYAGQLDNLKKVFKGPKDPGVTKKLGFYLVTEEPGVPNVAFQPVYHATDSSKNYALKDPVLNKQHTDAIAAMKKENASAVALMKKYTGSYSGSMNHSIWGSGGTPEEKEMGRLMIKYSPVIPVGTVLRRHIDLSGQTLKDMLNSAGKVLQEPAGMSTGVNKNHSWSGNVHLHLTAGLGVKALYVAPMSHHSHEREMLTPPGTRYLVTKVETGPCGPQDPPPCGKYRVHAIILPTEDGQCC